MTSTWNKTKQLINQEQKTQKAEETSQEKGIKLLSEMSPEELSEEAKKLAIPMLEAMGHTDKQENKDPLANVKYEDIAMTPQEVAEAEKAEKELIATQTPSGEREIVVFDHETHPSWSKQYDSSYARRGKTNGAYTYSVDIVKYYVPTIKQLLRSKEIEYTKVAIVTVGYLTTVDNAKEFDLCINFLHKDYAHIQGKVQEALKVCPNTIFITSRADVIEKLKEVNVKCAFVPMAIDVKEIQKYAEKADDKRKFGNNMVLYFGNIYFDKGASLGFLKQFLADNRIQFHSIIDNVYTVPHAAPKTLNRAEVLRTVSRYSYGVGVGRAYLEMNALGVKTFLFGARNAGAIFDEDDFQKHALDNFSSRNAHTGDSMKSNWADKSDILLKSFDVKEALPILKKNLYDVLHGITTFVISIDPPQAQPKKQKKKKKRSNRKTGKESSNVDEKSSIITL